MKIYTETALRNFDFWAGAADRAAHLTCAELDTIEAILEDCAPEEGWTDTEINDFFWFEFDTIADWLGYESEEAFFEDREKD